MLRSQSSMYLLMCKRLNRTKPAEIGLLFLLTRKVFSRPFDHLSYFLLDSNLKHMRVLQPTLSSIFRFHILRSDSTHMGVPGWVQEPCIVVFRSEDVAYHHET